ncbi:uncharacterized protein TrAFT101_010203 [Trichoderma asperellum]|uniref:uncharacterized protein n=1 Tax=Trichoderma asperellum TaxID=101201 RepID=UPI00332A9FBB|nr:hypothetical protein TrAFT101_010203 [Trichoderma asperellum]
MLHRLPLIRNGITRFQPRELARIACHRTRLVGRSVQDYTPTLPFTVSQSYGVMNKALRPFSKTPHRHGWHFISLLNSLHHAMPDLAKPDGADVPGKWNFDWRTDWYGKYLVFCMRDTAL